MSTFSFIWFKSLVSQRRDLTGLDLVEVTKGQLFTGRMALELGLIDAIGSPEQAMQYFQTQGPKFKDISVKDWSLERNPTSLWNKLFSFYYSISKKSEIKFLESPVLFSIAS